MRLLVPNMFYIKINGKIKQHWLAVISPYYTKIEEMKNI